MSAGSTYAKLRVSLVGGYHDGYQGHLTIRGSIPMIVLEGTKLNYVYKLQYVAQDGVYHYALHHWEVASER